MQKAIYHEYFSYYLHAFGIKSALPFSPFGGEEVRGEKLEGQSNILMLEGKYEVTTESSTREEQKLQWIIKR